MKVTVCFGNVRVVVPCGGGDILVRDLIREATLRYRKATGKGPESWVAVHNLQSQGGGILDPDDRLSDVADDREQILASFEDGDGAHHHGGGDGASGSSVGTGSPDIFHDSEHKYGPNYPRTDIEVTGEQIASGDGVPGALQVRRGSEPALNQLPVGPPTPSEHTKRWSAAPIILEPSGINSNNNNNNSNNNDNINLLTIQNNNSKNILSQSSTLSGTTSIMNQNWNLLRDVDDNVDDNDDDDDDIDAEHSYNGNNNNNNGFRRIARDGSNRLSMQFLGDGSGYRWAEAAERAVHSRQTSTSLPREGKRKEPLGQANSTSPILGDSNNVAELIIIRNEPGPLGIHVVPDYDRLGKDRGILVQGIEPNGRIDRDGRLSIYDRIIEINGHNLINMPLQRIQEMFKLSLTSPELRLKIIKNNNSNNNNGLDNNNLRKHLITSSSSLIPTPIYPRYSDDKENVSMVECEQKQLTNTKVATVSPTKKVPAISKNLKTFLSSNTRKIGRKIDIELIKGPHGLGFSITTRDNPAGGNCPIYIKNIIPKGAAVEDKRLQIGDRLLEVNGIEMTGKSQSEAVAILRNAPLGSKVRIVVSRQEDVLDNDLPRIIDSSTADKEGDQNEIINNNDDDDDLPPNIPPLPQSHLQSLQNRTTDKINGSVAKIISQFQEAANPPEKMDESMIFPWKHREVLTLNIPVHDSEKAGLGISVKGKTSGTQDLGIFIKSVINGGAASRDKRLRTNDQLLNVNGISLLQQSNSDAMETLRKAMLHTEGPIPGNITLTIARRASSPSTPNRNFHNSINKSGSDSNLLKNSSGNELGQSTESEPSQSNNSGTSGSSTNTVIFNPNQEQSNKLNLSPMQTWNPVLDRLTGNNNHINNKQLRNESYYKAAHDTWLSTTGNNNTFNNLTSTTLNLTMAEPILIEDEYGSRVLNHQQQQQQQQNSRINIHITNKLNGNKINNLVENRSEHEPDGKLNNNNNSSSMILDSKMKSSESIQTSAIQNDATYASQLSLENPQGFSRDAFGRQSMSEKRHATLDAKSTDTYQRTKKLREERKNKEDADKLGQLGPSLGMKKSSSLESLQTMVQEIQMKEEGDPAYSYRGTSGALKVIRGRGCEESFRAAVVDKHIVDPNHPTENGAKKHWLLDGPIDNEREIDGFNNVRGAPRQSSLNAALDSKHNKINKKKQGLFKGIGSMFRFGKHRKMEFNSNNDVVQQYHQVQEDDNHNPTNDNQNFHIEQQKVQEQQNQFLQQQHLQQQQQMQRERESIYQRHGFLHRHAEQVQVIPENSVAPPVKYRNTEQLRRGERKLHEQRLAQKRHTYYPNEEQVQRIDPIYGEYGRPGSRSGITDSVPFTHYVNYNELQNHLSRKQHQYHSQRQTRSDNNQLRPVSNFYEYESVQSMLNSRGGRPHMSSSVTNQQQQQQQQQQHYHDINANSLTRQQGPTQGRHHGRNLHHRGPFVTHVTIGDHNQQNGTKV